MTEYKKYPEYKDIGVEWLGEIPSDWFAHNIAKNSKTVSGSGFPHEYQHALTEEIPFLKVNALAKADREGIIRWQKDTVSTQTAKILNAKIIPAGSVVIAKVGAALLLSRIRILSKDSCIDNNMTAIIFDENKVFNRFGYYALQQIDFKTIVSPGVIPSLNDKALKSFSLAWPPLEVQKQIGVFLDAETKKIDDSIVSMESLISLLTEKRSALISETVTRGMPGKHTEFKDSGVEWIGKIPAEWNLVKGKKVISISKEIVGDRESQYNRLSLTMNGVLPKAKEGANGLSPDSFSTYQILRPNELVFKMIDLENRKTSRVGLSFHEGLVSSAYIVARTKANFSEMFASYYYQSLYLQGIYNFLGSGVRSTLNADDMKEIPVSLPSLLEQEEIVEFLNEETKKIDSVIHEVKVAVALLKEKRQRLISDAVTGKIDVRDIVN